MKAFAIKRLFWLGAYLGKKNPQYRVFDPKQSEEQSVAKKKISLYIPIVGEW